ncbi:MAG: FecR family protein [Verrucomicrobiota bacterium]|nr:FecR family protein [Verrucomicrobiota bacterium]
MNEPRLIELLDGYFDRALAPVHKAELEAMLRASDEARSVFWQRARLHSGLRLLAQRKRGQRLAHHATREPRVSRRPHARQIRPVAPAPAARPPRRSRASRWLLGSATVVAIALAVVFWPSRQPVRRTSELARIVHAVSPGRDSQDRKQSDALRQGGPLKVVNGVIELEFASGARVVIQGPARLDLADQKTIHLLEGRLSAQVPARARGFKVMIPGGKVVVRGTRFGVVVEPEGVSAVHVFEGKLHVLAAGSQQLSLRAGEAIAARAGNVVRMRADEAQFPRASRILTDLLAAGDFEPGTRVDAMYVPKTFARWSGDAANIVGPVAGVAPQRGAGMLSFTPPGASYETIEQWQLVDMGPVLRAALGAPVKATLSAWFNRAAGATSHAGSGVLLGAFRGRSADAASLWRHKDQMALALADSILMPDLDPVTWERAEAKINVPPEANFLLVQVAASPTRETDPFSPGRNAHFADSAELKIDILPAPSSSHPGAAR